MAKRIMLKQINKALAEEFGVNMIELVKGKSYFYFAGRATCGWAETIVYVNRLSLLTVKGWVKEAIELSEAN